jgi:xanthine dehydrogenase YagS FAD-binding subunit
MKAFEYASPATPEQAVAALGGGSSAVLSGGTEILNRLKDYVSSVDRLVYINDIKALAGISGDPRSGGITIGAATKLSEILHNTGIAGSYPALLQAAQAVGTPQIRHMATLGGNLLQRPRCWYYRNGFGLLGMKDGRSLVRQGDNRFHSIFMTDGDALFVSPSSLAVALIALGAKATIMGSEGERTVSIDKLYQVPRSEDDRELTIRPGELLTKVTIPEARGKNAVYEVRHKQAHDWPIVMAAVSVDSSGGKVSDATVVLFGVAPIPLRSTQAEQAIKGKAISMETATAAGAAAVEGAKPLSMNGYKVALTRTAVKRALMATAGMRYWETT